MRTILCIDDHSASLLSLAMILRSSGYCCITAQTAEEADRRFAAHAIDLVIVDHGLPDMDGATLAAHLKEIRPVYVLMLTGNPNVERPFPRVDKLLHKPQAPEVLLAEIAKIFEFSAAT